jgi:hypothetical protein
MTNETRQPNAIKRRRTFAEASIFTELSGVVMALITARSEVEVFRSFNEVREARGLSYRGPIPTDIKRPTMS